jgi:hypothetical protein
MGTCGNCVNYSDDTLGLLQRHYCTLHSLYSGEKPFYVSESGTCPQFREKTTKKNSGYVGGGCFLTSACVDYLGKSDDCKELTYLRKFRDEYMKKTESGRKLVDEYYSIAPQIVDRINNSDKKDTYYKYIYEVIERCVQLIKVSENERVLNEYKFMVLNLKKEFNL